jgi:hypothetical protein
MRAIPYSRAMVRASLVVFIVTGACIVACGTEHERIPDAQVQIDAPGVELGSGSGSGSDEMAMEPSPHDRNLELVVVASSLIVAVGPVIGSRRRRRHPPNIL